MYIASQTIIYQRVSKTQVLDLKRGISERDEAMDGESEQRHSSDTARIRAGKEIGSKIAAVQAGRLAVEEKQRWLVR